MLALAIAAGGPAEQCCLTVQAQTRKAKANSKANSKAGKSKANTKAGKPKSNSKTRNRRETSADVQKQAKAVQQEVKQTQEELRQNEASIKRNLSALGKLEEDIKVSKGQIEATSSQIGTLDKKIGTLQTGIAGNERELEKMRSEYLKAVKKMRVARKNTSALAFIFASDNFNQAMRRIRYLRQFGEWKDRQTAAINNKTEQLRQQTTQLSKTRSEKSVALRSQKAAEEKLRKQHASQDAIVAELRKNGEALNAHLAKKRAEAAQLRNRVAALIAEEERQAAEERARIQAAREEEARRKEQERLQAIALAEQKAAEERERVRRQEEREAQLRAERERKLALEKEREIAEAQKRNDQERVRALKKAEKERKAAEERERKAAEERRRKAEEQERKALAEAKKRQEKAEKDYAEARSRAPRANNPAKASSSSASAPAKISGGNFAAMRGNLPKPASGSFRVTSRYGRQSFPDLPDVTFDNTGIDAEVSNGASALAVYPGRVSKMVRMDGYGTVIIVNHGDYYTVYGNLSAPAVKIGDLVKAGQTLGSIAADEDDPSHGSIHFEVWKNKQRQNPLDWIRL